MSLATPLQEISVYSVASGEQPIERLVKLVAVLNSDLSIKLLRGC